MENAPLLGRIQRPNSGAQLSPDESTPQPSRSPEVSNADGTWEDPLKQEAAQLALWLRVQRWKSRREWRRLPWWPASAIPARFSISRLRHQLYAIFSAEPGSKAGRIVRGIEVATVLLFLIVFTVASLPQYRSVPSNVSATHGRALTGQGAGPDTSTVGTPVTGRLWVPLLSAAANNDPQTALEDADTLSVVIFTILYLLRLVTVTAVPDRQELRQMLTAAKARGAAAALSYGGLSSQADLPTDGLGSERSIGSGRGGRASQGHHGGASRAQSRTFDNTTSGLRFSALEADNSEDEELLAAAAEVSDSDSDGVGTDDDREDGHDGSASGSGRGSRSPVARDFGLQGGYGDRDRPPSAVPPLTGGLSVPMSQHASAQLLASGGRGGGVGGPQAGYGAATGATGAGTRGGYAGYQASGYQASAYGAASISSGSGAPSLADAYSATGGPGDGSSGFGSRNSGGIGNGGSGGPYYTSYGLPAWPAAYDWTWSTSGLLTVTRRGLWRTATFATRSSSIVDLLSFLPWYLDYIFEAHPSDPKLVAFRILRFLRVLRLLRPVADSLPFRLLKRAMSEAGGVLKTSFLPAATVAVLTFSCAIFVCEGGSYDAGTGTWRRPTVNGEGTEVSPFRSVPDSMWWTIVTLSTLGYGDFVPTSPLGKVVATAAIGTGIALLALPATMIGLHFSRAYDSHMRRMERRAAVLRERERQRLKLLGRGSAASVYGREDTATSSIYGASSSVVGPSGDGRGGDGASGGRGDSRRGFSLSFTRGDSTAGREGLTGQDRTPKSFSGGIFGRSVSGLGLGLTRAGSGRLARGSSLAGLGLGIDKSEVRMSRAWAEERRMRANTGSPLTGLAADGAGTGTGRTPRSGGKSRFGPGARADSTVLEQQADGPNAELGKLIADIVGSEVRRATAELSQEVAGLRMALATPSATTRQA